jgi:hypothetical protein
MRAVSLVLIAGFLSLAAASAEAASINPNPVNETRAAGAPGGALNANVTALSVSGNIAIFQLSVVTGSVTGVDIGMLLSTLTPPPAPTLVLVTGAAFEVGSGTGGTASIGGGGTQAQFDFSSVIGAGGTSQAMRVTFSSAIPTGYFGTVNFDNGYVTTKNYQVVAPEPAGLVLAGLALGALAAVRRRRASD